MLHMEDQLESGPCQHLPLGRPLGLWVIWLGLLMNLGMLVLYLKILPYSNVKANIIITIPFFIFKLRLSESCYLIFFIFFYFIFFFFFFV